MIKDILVNLAVGDKPDVAADYAIAVAMTLNAHLASVAFAYEPIVPGAIFDGVSASVVASFRAESKKAAKLAVERFEEAVRRVKVSAESRVIGATEGGAAEIFGRLARRFDLSIVSQSDPQGGTDDLILEAALFESGRPIVVVPYIQKTPAQSLKLDRVLLCWDGSRHAARAFADALPLLTRGKSIDVISIATKEDNQGEISGADIAHHLARHGLKVELNRIVAPDTDVASTILSHAADTSADLVVMGGYGHSRLREFVLGGATRGMLSSMTVPTFMSH
jgi:nucleotide-binding universal stress UspA family protein